LYLVNYFQISIKNEIYLLHKLGVAELPPDVEFDVFVDCLAVVGVEDIAGDVVGF